VNIVPVHYVVYLFTSKVLPIAEGLVVFIYGIYTGWPKLKYP